MDPEIDKVYNIVRRDTLSDPVFHCYLDTAVWSTGYSTLVEYLAEDSDMTRGEAANAMQTAYEMYYYGMLP